MTLLRKNALLNVFVKSIQQITGRNFSSKTYNPFKKHGSIARKVQEGIKQNFNIISRK